jgi:hypothetical protein
MKTYLERLSESYDRSGEELISPEGEAGLKKIEGKLMPGAKCAWCFRDDVEFWKSEKLPYPYPARWPYQGFIMPFPETNGRSEMEEEDVCVVVVDYPIEKENPVTDWTTLARLLTSPELHRFYVFSNIVTKQ